MAAIFPPASKGGVPPGGGVAFAYVPVHPVTGEGPLYVSSSCATALTADQMNGLTSEHLAAVDLLGFSYNSAKVTNLADALVARFADKLTRSGDTMTGPLYLSSHPITGNFQAVTKVYVDGNIAGVQSAVTGAFQAADTALQGQINGKVAKAGDTMTGFLTLHAEPTNAFHAATKAYVDGHAGSGGGGIPEAPYDGATYGRRNNGWELVVNLSGSTMMGSLLLPLTPPTLQAEATNKQYVDNQVASAVATIDSKVAKGGDTMSGALTLPGNPTVALHAATKGYVDAADTVLQGQITTNNTTVAGKVAKAGDTMTGALTLPGDPTVPLHAATKAYVDVVAGQVAARVAKAGDSMSGFLTLNADPTSALHAATKAYVDSHGGVEEAPSDGQVYGRQNAAWVVAGGGGGAGYLPLAGGTMAGFITLHAAPTSTMHAATKQYVDGRVARAGDTMSGALTLSGAPTVDLHAATKKYVDDTSSAAASSAASGKVSKTGDTMSGALTLPGNPANPLEAAPKQYVDSSVTGLATTTAVNAADAALQAQISASTLRGYLYGLTLANNASDAVNDIDVAAGAATSTDSSPALMTLAASMTKRLDANWAPGSNQGGVDSASGLSNITYHVYLIMRPDTGAVDVIFSQFIGPIMPPSYTKWRRIGSFVRAAGSILRFFQQGDRFWWKATANDFQVTNGTLAATLRPLRVPIGIKVVAHVYAFLNGSTTNATHFHLSSPDADDAVPVFNTGNNCLSSPANATAIQASGDFYILTDTSGQIRSRVDYSDAGVIILGATKGWIDHRGRLEP